MYGIKQQVNVRLEAGDSYEMDIYLCMGFLWDTNTYDSAAVFIKNYARLSLINDMLYGKYEITATGEKLIITNIGGKTSVMNLFIAGS